MMIRPEFGDFYAAKRVLLTGAAGSVGSALAKQLAALGCAELALLDHFDHGLLAIAEAAARINPDLGIVDILGDIRDGERLAASFARFAPDVVIHAAALKHVHLGERHPGECILTNLVGFRNVLMAADAAGARHLTLISSDKAAAPACVMGAAKRLAELHLHCFPVERQTSMALRAVRFGNVIGSQGSVTPRFAEQIAAGGPVTITHALMQRFFMTEAAAVDLVLDVTALCDRAQARTYYMDMGEPVSIMNLAHEMIANAGRSVAIEVTGLRPGEKLKEQLFDEYETVARAGRPGVYSVEPESIHGYVSAFDVEELEQVARTLDDASVRERVFALLNSRLGRSQRLAV